MTGKDLMGTYAAMGGGVSGEELERLGRDAWRLLVSQSRGRVRQVQPETPEGRLVRDCFRALVEDGETSEQGTVASETLGQWSRTYRNDQQSREQRRASILREYLGETGLLYRGWRP